MTDSNQTRGSRLLEAWIGDRTQAQVAAQLGVSAEQLNHWLRGRRAPELRHAIHIEEVTMGAVPAKAWVST